MSAETLREAAALMRERAEAATPGGPRWETAPSESAARFDIFPADSDSSITSAPRDDAVHIASWDPAVALAVADWLDVTARDVGTSSIAFHAALAVARAYLGDDRG